MAADGNSAARRRTKRIIRDSLLRLLETKPFEQITVRDLCEEADVNRATFYRYYPDLYALNDELADDLFQKMFTDLAERSARSGKSRESSVKDRFLEALTIIEENKRLCLILLGNPTGSFTLRLRSAFEKAIYLHDDYRLMQETDLMMSYMIGGLISAVHAWLASGCAVRKDTFADMLDRSFMDAYAILSRFQ